MSGGSYQYLYSRDFGEEDLERMADRLDQLGYASWATQTRRLIATENPGLRNVWKAVEWLDSCDWTEPQARQVIEEQVQH